MSRLEKYLEVPSQAGNAGEVTSLTTPTTEQEEDPLADFRSPPLSVTLKEVADDLAWLPECVSNLEAERSVARIVARGRHLNFEPQKSVVMRENKGKKPSVAHFTRDHVCGPAVQLAFWANVFAWGLYVALAPLGLSFYSCSGENLAKFTQMGLALFALILVVSLSLSMFLEYKMARYYLPAHVAICRPPEKCAVRHEFWVLAPILGVLSALAKCDLLTNPLFVAKMTKSEMCDPHITKVWTYVWSHSIFSYSPMNFSEMCKCVWLLMLLQPLYAFLYCPSEAKLFKHLVNMDERNETFKVQDRELNKGRFSTYRSWMNEKTHCGETLSALSYAGRLTSDQFFSSQGNEFLCEKGAFTSGQVYCFMKQQILYSLVFQMLVLVLQVEIQGSAIEVVKGLDHLHRPDVQLTVGVCLNVVVGLSKIVPTVNHIRFLASQVSIAVVEHEDTTEEQKAFNKRCQTRTPLVIAVWGLCVVLFAVSMVHGITKFVMVTFVCKNGWNVRWSLREGCVPHASWLHH